MIFLGSPFIVQFIILFFSLVLPVALFYIGYYLGKKAGYSKRREEEKAGN
ncbi:hypothetical protein ACFSX9_07500 [Flavobacterium ardleyense]|uniref:Uncharacterized protein n=1 Tax=Flavobacterium ardleyense TaxID=2038737 RepID=A0ABW5Z6W4_9FLAO